jgi:hypothetical protein
MVGLGTNGFGLSAAMLQPLQVNRPTCTGQSESTWTKDQGPRTKDQGPRTKDQGPRTKDQGPRTKDQGPGTRDQPGPIDYKTTGSRASAKNVASSFQIPLVIQASGGIELPHV